jgi:hypothetical protein
VRAETAEADQGRAEFSPWMRWFVRGLQRNLDRPRTQYNVLLGFAAVVLLTLLAYTSAQGAGVALGEFLVEGNAVRQKPLLEWPRASTSPIGGAEPKTARCVIVLGRRDGVYAFFVPRDSRVEFAAAETVTVDVPPSHPDCKADAVWEPRAAER